MGTNLTLINHTEEFVRIAIFKQRYKAPRLNTVAWKIENPDHKGGACVVAIPTDFVIFVSSGECATQKITINANEAKFVVQGASTSDGADTTITLEGPLPAVATNQINIENLAQTCVSTHIQKGGSDIYPSQQLAYGQTHEEDVRPSLYLAVINEFVHKGDRLVDADISTSPFEALGGDTVVLTGAICGPSGYTFTNVNG